MTRSAFDKYQSKLTRELRKLERTTAEQPRARRNARKRVLTAMRQLRAEIDEAFPAIVDRTGTKRLKTFAGRLARAKRAGWRALGGDQLAAAEAGQYAALGIRVTKIEHTDDGGGEARGRPGQLHRVWLVPAWADAIGVKNTAQLRAALKSRKLRNAALTCEALSS